MLHFQQCAVDAQQTMILMNQLKTHYDHQTIQLNDANATIEALRSERNEERSRIESKEESVLQNTQASQTKIEQLQRALQMFETVTVPHYEKEAASLKEKIIELEVQQRDAGVSSRQEAISSFSSFAQQRTESSSTTIVSIMQNRVDEVKVEMEDLRLLCSTLKIRQDRVVEQQNTAVEHDTTLQTMLRIKEMRIVQFS